MKGMLLTPHELSEIVFESGHQGLIGVYPQMLFSTEQQLQLVKFLVESGEIRQVIKIGKEFPAVKGHCKDNNNIEAESIIRLPPGYYVTDSKTLIGRENHTYVYGLDDVAYTVVDDVPQHYYREDLGAYHCFVLNGIRVDTLNLYDVLLFGPDLKMYLDKIGANKPTALTGLSTVSSTSINRKGTLDDLIEVTGTSNAEDAIGVAIWHVEQAELENEKLDRSLVLTQFKRVLNQCEKGELQFKTLTQAEKFLKESYKFTTRQANVFGQEIMKQMPE